MVLSAHDLGSHVARGSTGVFLVLWIPNPSNSKISDPEIPIGLKHQVLRLDVSVNYSFVMHVFKSYDNTSDVESDLLLCEPPVLGNVVSQVSSVQQVHHKVQVLSVLKSVVHVDQESDCHNLTGASADKEVCAH